MQNHLETLHTPSSPLPHDPRMYLNRIPGSFHAPASYRERAACLCDRQLSSACSHLTPTKHLAILYPHVLPHSTQPLDALPLPHILPGSKRIHIGQLSTPVPLRPCLLTPQLYMLPYASCHPTLYISWSHLRFHCACRLPNTSVREAFTIWSSIYPSHPTCSSSLFVAFLPCLSV